MAKTTAMPTTAAPQTAAEQFAALEAVRDDAADRLRASAEQRVAVLRDVAAGRAELAAHAALVDAAARDKALVADVDAALAELRPQADREARVAEVMATRQRFAADLAKEERPDSYRRLVRELAREHTAKTGLNRFGEPPSPTPQALSTWMAHFLRRGEAGEPAFVVTNDAAMRAAFKADALAFLEANAMEFAIGHWVKRHNVAMANAPLELRGDRAEGQQTFRPGPWR